MKRSDGGRLPLLAMMAIAGLAGCELAEVSAPAGADVLVVEAVLQAGMPRQFVLLHHVLADGAVRGEPGASVSITPESGTPIDFEMVDLGECFVADPERWEIEGLEIAASCYRSPVSAGGFVVPGRRYDLRVSTVNGLELRGRTIVPGRFELRSPRAEVDSLSFSVNCFLPTDPFTLTWTRAEGAWAYITSLRLSAWGDSLREQGIQVPEPLDLTGLSISAADTSQLFPANIGLFQRFDLDPRILIRLREGLPQAADATVVILALDPNYANAIRGGRFNPSGQVRNSSIAGDGIGVFGSVAPMRIYSPNRLTSAPGRLHECGPVLAPD